MSEVQTVGEVIRRSFSITTAKEHCVACGQEFDCEFIHYPNLKLPSNRKTFPMQEKCGECRGIPEKPVRVAPPAPDPSRLEKRWESMCPHAYRDIDANTLPEEPMNLRQLYRTWRLGNVKPGLMLLGGTGTQKSRTTFAIVERQFYLGKTVAVETPQTFFATFSSPDTSATELLRYKAKLINSDILLFDDLTQSEWTPRVGAVLYEVIEARTAQRKSIITSSNYKGPEFLERLPKAHGMQIMRRLADQCEIIYTGATMTQAKLPF